MNAAQTDARFQDGGERPLALIAQNADDVPILSALLQDAVFPAAEMVFVRKRRRFALMISRFRWEDADAAKTANRPYERVQSLLVIHDVLAVRSTGFDPKSNVVLSLLSAEFTPSVDGAGTLTLTLSCAGAIALDIEALDITLRDVTRPHLARSKTAPDHGL